MQITIHYDSVYIHDRNANNYRKSSLYDSLVYVKFADTILAN